MKEALKLALDKKAENARELGLDYEPENTLHWHALNYRTAPTQNADKMFKALEKFVKNSIKEGLTQSKEEKLHPVHIGVDVTKEGTAVTAFYRKPDAVMEMFYSQFHPMAQPEQEPVAHLWQHGETGRTRIVMPDQIITAYTTPPQRTWVGLDPEEIRKTNHHMVDGAYHYSFKQGAEWAEAKLKEKNT